MRSGKTDNPFIVQRLGPEGTDYIFTEGDSAAAWLERLEQAGGAMELTGPHGVGKSTLLRAVGEEAERRGAKVARFRFSDERRRLPWGWKSLARGADLCLIDGGERLAPFGRRQLIGFCRKWGIKIIATTHESLDYGESHRIETTPQALAKLVQRLLKKREDIAPVGVENCVRLLKKYDSARAALFAMYDAFEQGRLEELLAAEDG